MASDEINRSLEHSLVNEICQNEEESQVKPKSRYTGRQWRILIVFAFVNICSAMCYSLQSPFYPKEASKKGIGPSVYGFVFGVFELVDFIACPIYGKFIRQIGPKFMLNAGNFVMALCCILFGFLDQVKAGTPFIALSFAVRIVEALGQAGFITASYSILAYEFPDNIASTFSIVETLFAIGIILGPTIGGILYEIGGFILPFAVNGGALLGASFVTYFILPEIKDAQPRNPSFIKLLRIPSVSICYYAVVAVAFSYGFTFVLLEPQLRQFNLSPSLVGVIFVVSGVSYALTAVIWGFLADKHIHPMILCGIGGLFISLAFLLLGPAPFIPLQNQLLWLEVVALVLQGIGTGAEYIAAFIDSSRQAIKHGMPDDIETYGLISGLWASGLALGSFLGPTLIGLISDKLDFRQSTLIVVGQQIFVVILSFGAYFYQKHVDKTTATSEEKDRLLDKSQINF